MKAFNCDELMDRAKLANYHAGKPYPHVILDFAANPEVLERALKDFPEPGQEWTLHGGPTDQKLEGHHYPQSIKAILDEMNSKEFADFLFALTGEKEIIVDDSYHGGGMHMTTRGGFLKIHTDFNIVDLQGKQVKRTLNAILFLNKGWKPEYGGYLEMWNEDMTECVQRIAPFFNRLVVFSISDTSWHGHPDPLKADARKSLATYYYRAVKEGEVIEPHDTIYKKRPGEKW